MTLLGAVTPIALVAHTITLYALNNCLIYTESAKPYLIVKRTEL